MPKNARCFGQDLMKGENETFRSNKRKPNAFRQEAQCRERERESKFKGGLANGLHALRESQKAGLPEPEYQGQETSGTSIFDPVLCEIIYRWFCPPGGPILDPFAGGSVRGIVAAYLGYKYTGVDLSENQIKANREQADEILKDGNKPDWIVGDSLTNLPEDEVDLIFSCPPYADLEIYSDDPRDISTMPYDEFLEKYRAIIKQCVQRLRDNRFACFVVGDVRDKQGFYRKFPWHTIQAFEDAGMKLYNEAVLVTAVGSLPIRIGRQFGSYRKLGKTHQNVLIFYKGNPKAIKEEFGEIDLSGLLLPEGGKGERLE
jgi:DNA modification methylase